MTRSSSTTPAPFSTAPWRRPTASDEIARRAGLVGDAGGVDAGLAVTAEEADRDRRGDTEARLARAASTVRDLLG